MILKIVDSRGVHKFTIEEDSTITFIDKEKEDEVLTEEGNEETRSPERPGDM